MYFRNVVFVVGCLLVAAPAVAQQSEFQQQIHNALNYYRQGVMTDCGTSDKLTIEWESKLANAPTEPEQKGWLSIHQLGSSAVQAVDNACSTNKVVSKALSKMTALVVTRGKGAPTFKLEGTKVTVTIDPSSKDDAGTQRAALVLAIKKELDQ
jgi:hypothetical protein